MKYHIVDFQRSSVRAAAAENTDWTFTFYVNARLPEEDRERAVEELNRKLIEEIADEDPV